MYESSYTIMIVEKAKIKVQKVVIKQPAINKNKTSICFIFNSKLFPIFIITRNITHSKKNDQKKRYLTLSHGIRTLNKKQKVYSHEKNDILVQSDSVFCLANTNVYQYWINTIICSTKWVSMKLGDLFCKTWFDTI